VLPPTSQTYVNLMLPESDHILFFCPREVPLNLSWPFYSLSLELHESAITRVQSSLDSKSTKLFA
jgi:hypothetical protein